MILPYGMIHSPLLHSMDNGMQPVSPVLSREPRLAPCYTWHWTVLSREPRLAPRYTWHWTPSVTVGVRKCQPSAISRFLPLSSCSLDSPSFLFFQTLQAFCPCCCWMERLDPLRVLSCPRILLNEIQMETVGDLTHWMCFIPRGLMERRAGVCAMDKLRDHRGDLDLIRGGKLVGGLVGTDSVSCPIPTRYQSEAFFRLTGKLVGGFVCDDAKQVTFSPLQNGMDQGHL